MRSRGPTQSQQVEELCAGEQEALSTGPAGTELLSGWRGSGGGGGDDRDHGTPSHTLNTMTKAAT